MLCSGSLSCARSSFVVMRTSLLDREALRVSWKSLAAGSDHDLTTSVPHLPRSHGDAKLRFAFSPPNKQQARPQPRRSIVCRMYFVLPSL